MHIIRLAHLKCFMQQFTLHGIALPYLLLHAGIYFLPKTGYGTHTRRMHFLQRLQHVGRPQIDGQLRTFGQAEVRPRPLKHMGERKEVQHDILFPKRQDRVIGNNRIVIHPMAQHHPLAGPRGSRGIKYIGQVVHPKFGRTPLQLLVPFMSGTGLQKLLKINRHRVLRVLYHGRIENNQFLKRRTMRHATESDIVLVLFADKHITNFGIVHHVNHLALRTGSIKRYRDGPHAVSPEIHVQAFGHVLRKNSQILLHIHPQSQQGCRYLPYDFRKPIPGNRNPHILFIIAIAHGRFVAITFGLFMDEH